LKQLDVAQHPIVERNRQVVRRLTQVRLDVFGGRGGRRGSVKGADGEELVDGGRLGSLFGEAVTGRQGRQLQRRNAVHEPVQVLADASVGACVVRRREQEFECGVECGLRLREMSERELMAPVLEQPIGRRQQLAHRIDRRRWVGRGGHVRCGFGSDVGRR
jgi:hypothetical protein